MIKNLLFLGIVIFAVANLQAQNYMISFAGTGLSTTVESVEVTNVTQNKSLTIAGTDVLNLVASVTGIDEGKFNGANGLSIYPNPMSDVSNIRFEMQNAGLVNVQLFDITGKQVAVLQNNLSAGVHNFSVNNLYAGFYTVLVGCDGNLYSQKIVSLNSAVGQASINYVGSSSNRVTKNTKAVVQMQYNIGDELSIKGISGTYITTTIMIPTGDATITFNFSLSIGDNYGGGKVAYILQSGDPGYIVGETHGFIVSTLDQGIEIMWWNGTYISTGATATALGSGKSNTDLILTVQGNSGIYAAKLCKDYNGGGYSDWYLPSKDELHKIWINKAVLGISESDYWSSSEVSETNACYEYFHIGSQLDENKMSACKVRAIRNF